MANDDRFLIYIDRLKDQQTEVLNFLLPPSFLQIEEKELRFNRPVKVDGKAYLAHDELIVDLDIVACAEMPCAICNEPTEVPIELDHVLLVEPWSDSGERVYDLRPAVREAILLELPLRAECAGGCPKRAELEKFLKKESSDGPDKGEFHPFGQLSADDYER